MLDSIRNMYNEMGVEQFYMQHGDTYLNPHESIIKKLLFLAKENHYIGHHVLDLCCGSGEITMMLKDCNVTGVDPYTRHAYYKRTGYYPLPWTFKDIAQGKLCGVKYDTIICSFAMHLCEKSLLPNLLWQLGELSNRLIIITPNNKPNCDKISKWLLVDEYKIDRVNMNIYMK